MQRHTVSITTDAEGNATGRTAPVNGTIRAIRYVFVDMAATSDFTITGDVSGIAILTATDVAAAPATWYPRAATCDVVGAASLHAAGGEPVEDGIPVCDEAVKVVVAQGGATKTGTLYVYVG